MLDPTVAIVLIASIAAIQASGLDVEIRGSNDKVVVDGSQSRGIYQVPKMQLSPHRMMHFGKRPETYQAPFIVEPRILDPQKAITTLSAVKEAFELQPERFPYLLSIELEHGRTLQAIPDDFEDTQSLVVKPSGGLGAALGPPLDYGYLGERRANLDGQRFLKLIREEHPTNFDADDLVQPNPEKATASQSQQQQNGQEQPINVSTRSGMRNNINIPRAFISGLLHARPASTAGLTPYINYNKKAEPKDNIFMHFGRK